MLLVSITSSTRALIPPTTGALATHLLRPPSLIGCTNSRLLSTPLALLGLTTLAPLVARTTMLGPSMTITALWLRSRLPQGRIPRRATVSLLWWLLVLGCKRPGPL